MPDFRPLLWMALKPLLLVLIFVALVLFITYLRKQWSKAG